MPKKPCAHPEMHKALAPSLTADELDDLLYFARANECEELQAALVNLSQKYRCSSQEVLSASADSASGNTVLHYCSANGYADLLTSMLSELAQGPHSQTSNGTENISTPAFINRQNGSGNTALHWAAINGQLECVKALVEHGADVWIKNGAGHLAMFEAEQAEKDEVVRYLLEAGGRRVEQTGAESQVAAEDVDVDPETESSTTNGSAHAGEGADVNMEYS